MYTSVVVKMAMCADSTEWESGMRRFRWPIVALAMFLAGSGLTAWDGHSPAPASYTGCLNTATGAIAQVKRGSSPLTPCSSGRVKIHLSGGDITSVLPAANGGLTGGSDNDTVRLGINYPSVDRRYVNEAQVNSVTGAMVADASIGTSDLSDSLQSQLQNTIEVMRTVKSCIPLGRFGGANGQDLRFCSYVGVNASGSVFENVDLRYADLRDADFSYVEFSAVNLIGADLTGTNLSEATYSDVACPDATRSDDNGGNCDGHLTP